MPPITVKSRAAISVLAARLAPMLTNPIIASIADENRLPTFGSNKVDRLRSMLEAVETDGRRSNAGARLLTVLVLEANARAVDGKAEFAARTLDELLGAARTLSWDVRELRAKGWRTAIKGTAADNVPPPIAFTPPGPTSAGRVAPSRHDEALTEVMRLVHDHTVTPQQRGRQIELVVFDILRREGLRPLYNVVVQGEQIDLAFDLGGGHYIVECKWLKDRVGDPDVSRLAHKVARRAVGVRGVFLAMNGFVSEIEQLVRGDGQQHCIGLDRQHLMSILEGRTTWTELVVRGWRDASFHRRFLVPR